MKNTLIAITMLTLFGFAIAPIVRNVNYYATTAEVVGFDYEHNEIILETWAGFEYRYKGIEDWYIGDIAALCMNDKGTEFIDDDKIVSVRYTRVDYDSPHRDVTISKKLQKEL